MRMIDFTSVRFRRGRAVFGGCALIVLLSLQTSGADVSTRELMRVGYMTDSFSGIDIEDAKVALELLLDRMMDAHQETYETETLIYENYEDVFSDVQSRKVDLLSVGSVDFLEIREAFKLWPAVVTTMATTPTYEYVLLVSGEREIRSLAQLRGGRINFQKGSSGKVARLWMNTMLLRNALPESEAFFSTINSVDKVSRAVLPVFFGQADACIVHRNAYATMIEMNPQLEKRLVVLAESPDFLDSLMCFCEHVSPQMRKDVWRLSKNVHDDPNGQQILMLFHVKRTMPFRPEYLANIEHLYQDYLSLKADAQGGLAGAPVHRGAE